ncbi:hypothetical protein [Chloracidobacterium aggregatum]|nr:hypothetical protein [Chloracidobacterium aggregatum]
MQWDFLSGRLGDPPWELWFPTVRGAVRIIPVNWFPTHFRAGLD